MIENRFEISHVYEKIEFRSNVNSRICRWYARAQNQTALSELQPDIDRTQAADHL